GQEVIVPPRLITIHALEIVSFQSPDLVLDIDCGKGTYIRSLAFDLGRTLGPGAHLAGLIRTRSGPFNLEQSLSLEELQLILVDGSWEDHLYAPDEAMLEFGAAILGEQNEWRLSHGLELVPPTVARHSDGELLRTYSLDGRFLGIIRWEGDRGCWQPHKVLLGAG
ncbi:MAG: tRNA pseudouridine(55) synthase TruB, partial [Ktedonobacterales bacterium]